MSSDIFAGIGGSGYYYGLGLNLNLGKGIVVFVLGIDGKFCEFSWSDSFFTGPYYFKGLAFNPYIGLSLFGKEGFTLKLRAGVQPAYHYNQQVLLLYQTNLCFSLKKLITFFYIYWTKT